MADTMDNPLIRKQLDKIRALTEEIERRKRWVDEACALEELPPYFETAACGTSAIPLLIEARPTAAVLTTEVDPSGREVQRIRFNANDSRLQTEVGQKLGSVIRLRSVPGWGLFGPYLDIPAGSCTVRIEFAGRKSGGAVADIIAEGQTVLVSRAVNLGTLADQHLTLACDLPTDRLACEVRLHCQPGIVADISAVEIEMVPSPPDRELRSVIVGTTSQCNASCVHCPTNKTETSSLPQGMMPLPMFKRMVDQIADGQWRITSNLSLGLFGDGLLDPLVVQRCAYARERLPGAPIAVNTNGAAYDRMKHRALRNSISALSLHVESLKPEVYNRLMAPLRLERVLTKVEMILEDFGSLVTPGIPLHRENVDERDELTAYFKERGSGPVHFGPMTNRCSSETVFAELAFHPVGGSCRAEIANNIIVDWDGQVFLCCNDFRKENPIGNLMFQSVDEVLDDARRRAAIDHLVAGQWDEVSTCAKCKWDKVDPELVIPR